MKKFAILILSILSLAFTSAFFGAKFITASASETVETDAFMPASALELYSLTSPISVSYKDGFMVIAEYYVNPEDQTEFNRISVYNPNEKKFFALPEHASINNVTHAEYYNGYVYYLSGSYLYYVPVSNLNETPVKTTVTSSNFFSFNDNFLITNSSNSIVIYNVDNSNALPTFIENDPLTFTTKLALLSSEKDVYYIQAGKLYCYQARLNMTSHLVGELGVDVNYMVECGAYIYYTSTSGVYRIEKGKNKTPETVATSIPDANELGAFSSPQGITVRNGNLVIADPNLKAIQEIESTTGKFTGFAITTESTADYRLTSSASKIISSEDFVFVLDDMKALSDGTVYKRLVKISTENGKNSYESISLEPLYLENSEFKVELITVSNTHALIYDGINLSLYELDNLKKVYTIQNETVTTLNYLDGDFYYTDKALNESLSNEIINVHKITLPSQDNELTKITEHNLTEDSEITGSLINSTVDVFGNIYLLISDGSSSDKLIRYYNGNTSIPCEVTHPVKSFKTDFSGNVYMLSTNGVVYKYTYKNDTRTFESVQFTLATGNLEVKDIELNYRSNKCYVLSSACVLITTNDDLEISNLSGVSASDLKLTSVNENPTFLTVNKDAKLFKVTIGNYTQIGGVNYFKNITPISNPNTSRVYLVIAEIGDDYYLVSFSQKLIALVRKTTVNTDPTFKSDATIISPDKYADFGISITSDNNETFYISNTTNLYAKPIFDDNYKTAEIVKSTPCKAIKTIEFNGFKTTLIADENGEVLGYAPSGYLIKTLITTPTETTETVEVLPGDNGKLFNDSLMILLIALTVTLTLFFIEKKLLFNNEN